MRGEQVNLSKASVAGSGTIPIVTIRFNKQEAELRLGSTVRSKITVDGIPAGVTGHVVQLDEIERNGFDLIVEWSLLIQGKRQHNWFSKDDFERCLMDEI